MGHAASVPTAIPIELQFTALARQHNVPRSVVSFAHKRYAQLKAMLESHGRDRMSPADEESLRGAGKAIGLGSIAPALLHTYIADGVGFEEYLAAMVSFLHATPKLKIDMLLFSMFRLPDGCNTQYDDMNREDFVAAGTGRQVSLSEVELGQLFDAILAKKTSKARSNKTTSDSGTDAPVGVSLHDACEFMLATVPPAAVQSLATLQVAGYPHTPIPSTPHPSHTPTPFASPTSTGNQRQDDDNVGDNGDGSDGDDNGTGHAAPLTNKDQHGSVQRTPFTTTTATTRQ